MVTLIELPGSVLVEPVEVLQHQPRQPDALARVVPHRPDADREIGRASGTGQVVPVPVERIGIVSSLRLRSADNAREHERDGAP